MTEKRKETRGRKSNKEKGVTSKAVQPVSVWLSQATFDRLQEHVAKTKRVRSSLLLELIEDYLDSKAAKIREDAEDKAQKA